LPGPRTPACLRRRFWARFDGRIYERLQERRANLAKSVLESEL